MEGALIMKKQLLTELNELNELLVLPLPILLEDLAILTTQRIHSEFYHTKIAMFYAGIPIPSELVLKRTSVFIGTARKCFTIAGLCADYAVDILILSRKLKKTRKKSLSFLIRFAIIFNLYNLTAWRIKLEKMGEFSVDWPRTSGSHCFNFYSKSSVLFALYDFCLDVQIPFYRCIFGISDRDIDYPLWYLTEEAINLEFYEWCKKVKLFPDFFCNSKDISFPEIITPNYDLKVENGRIRRALLKECEKLQDQLEGLLPSDSESTAKDNKTLVVPPQQGSKTLAENIDNSTKPKVRTVQAEIDSKQKRNIKERFTINSGQALFDGKDLHIPTGLACDVLKKLVIQFGVVVKYKELDDNSLDKEASEQLRKVKSVIVKSFEVNKVPCAIESKTRHGYVIIKKTSKKTTKRSSKTHHK